MAAGAHQHIAVLLAIDSLFSYIGGAVGATVSSAIWTKVFPEKLLLYLPPEELPNFLMIYGDLETETSYPVGSLTRTAIQHAYGDAQRMMLIAGTSLWILGLGAVLMWRDIQLKGLKQVKGHVW
jgi:hypothetical protein